MSEKIGTDPTTPSPLAENPQLSEVSVAPERTGQKLARKIATVALESGRVVFDKAVTAERAIREKLHTELGHAALALALITAPPVDESALTKRRQVTYWQDYQPGNRREDTVIPGEGPQLIPPVFEPAPPPIVESPAELPTPEPAQPEKIPSIKIDIAGSLWNVFAQQGVPKNRIEDAIKEFTFTDEAKKLFLGGELSVSDKGELRTAHAGVQSDEFSHAIKQVADSYRKKYRVQ